MIGWLVGDTQQAASFIAVDGRRSVYDKRSDNVACKRTYLILHIGKFEAEVKDCTCGMLLKVTAVRHVYSIGRPVCDSRATCLLSL